MVNQIVLTVIILAAIICVLAFTEITYRRLDLKSEITRKFAHLSATLSTIIFPYIFSSHWYVLVLASFFFVILFVSRHGTQLGSIHKIERKSVGSYVLPVAVYLTFLGSYLLRIKFLYVLPILILAICDPMAGILGMNFKKNNKQIHLFGHTLQKTYLGSLSFLISSFIISVIALYLYAGVFTLKTFWLALGIGVITTLTEMLCRKGWDNLLIPLSAQLLLVFFL